MKTFFNKQRLLAMAEELGAWAFTGAIVYIIIWIATIG